MTSNGQRAYCPQCGAQLRRDQPMGAICDPCSKAGPGPLPPEFYRPEPVQAALLRYDFGVFFRRVRGYKEWSQRTLGGVLDMTQAKISAIEGGAPLYDIRVIARMHQRLGIPAGLLGFGDGATVVGGATTGQKGSWVDRRDFGQHVAGLVLGIAGATGLDLDRLLSLLPQAEPTGTRRIGAADVEVIEQTTVAFMRQDFAHGSGLVRDAAVAQLRSVLPLLNAQVGPEVRPRLMVATAYLALMAGYMSFDVQQQEAARRLWMIGLGIARGTDHPHGSDLTVYLLYDMALQAVYLNRPDEALHLIQVAHSAAAGRHPVSAATTSCLLNIEARAHAIRRDPAACDRALSQAVEQASTIEPATTPPWVAHVGEAGMSGFQGVAHYTLAMASRDPRAAARAVPLLRHGVDNYGPGYARLRGLYLPDLAGSHTIAGDLDTAVTVGHQAVDAVIAVSSLRAHDRLRTLNTVLEPLHASPGVAELRDRLAATAA